MARPIWKGHISFGLVHVPAQLQAAERRSDLQLHMVDSRNHARIRYDRVNAETGEEVPWDEIVKGYEYKDGSYVILSDEELKRAAPEVTQRIEIESFVTLDDIDTLYFDRPYYVEPGKGGEKGYVLLREALAETKRVGIARVVIRTRQYIAALLPKGDVLVLMLMRYPQELVSAKNLNIPHGSAKSLGVAPAEIKMAKMLVESMAAEWKPERYHDEYREALMKWIDKRIKSGQTEKLSEPLPEADEPPATLNFVELLKQSLKGGSAGGVKPTGGAKSERRPRKTATKARAKTASGARRRKAG